ncbi:MAG: rpsB [Candidatus Taylorbacteria bacterium]|nr:rpsB [Candidatus Taylorbacteria bacterium]
MTDKTNTLSKDIQEMVKVGAHFGFLRSRRHPSFKSLICGVKNMTEVIDLEKTEEMLKKAEEFVTELGKSKKVILFVSSKSEAMGIVRTYADSINMPFVASRWIGGTLTNFGEIKKRTHRLADLTQKKEKGELLKYTKKERLMFDREIVSLTEMFDGLKGVEKIPSAIFVVDAKKEHIAVAEAKQMGVSIITLSSSDNDIAGVNYPIAGNDASKASVEFFVSRIRDAYKKGTLSA